MTPARCKPTAIHTLSPDRATRATRSFLGYSFHFGQYWQYKSSAQSTTWSTWQPLSMPSLRQYRPLGFLLSVLCDSAADTRAAAIEEAVAGGGRGRGAPPVPELTCSRTIAQRRLHSIRESSSLRLMGGPLRIQLWVVRYMHMRMAQQ